MIIYPYNVASASVRALKNELGVQSIRLRNSRYRHRRGNKVLNYGNSRDLPGVLREDFINTPEAVRTASNKLATLSALEDAGIPTVEFTTGGTEAQAWLDRGNKVFVRHSLTGHSGEGIEVFEPRTRTVALDDFEQELVDIIQEFEESADTSERRSMVQQIRELLPRNTTEPEPQSLPDAPLYTLGIDNHGEYRVHVFDGEVILYQKKSRRVDPDSGEVDTPDSSESDVRNLASGWVYRTGNLRRKPEIEELAVSAIDALGLDFGAVDIIKDEDGLLYVLEVNTAPGLGNTETLEAYVEAINNFTA